MCYERYLLQADRYDVAVIRLNRQVDYAPHISPICLPPKVDFHFSADDGDIVEPCERFAEMLHRSFSFVSNFFDLLTDRDTDCFLSVKTAT